MEQAQAASRLKAGTEEKQTGNSLKPP